MASSQKLTKYERRRLKNIRCNEGMIAALRIHSKATQLFSTSSKRQSNVTKVVVGNEIGNVGFWDFNSSVNEREGERVYLYRPHLVAFQEFQCVNIPFQR
ncbi:hypothetical protein SO802_004996 [Lithocarpus litseifolius]|uniref:MADS-box domain-containing protein n=1 Tax=Lithocarpus litseifolius TaxID=425828 RepID=A0AAW2DGX1_9ROSI